MHPDEVRVFTVGERLDLHYGPELDRLRINS